MNYAVVSDDALIALLATAVALACVVFAGWRFARGRVGAGLVWLACAGVSAFVAYFFLTFQIRLF